MIKLLNPNSNKNLYEEYIKYLISLFYSYKKEYNIIIDNHYITYKCFYPLPTKLILNNKVIEDNNIYYLEENDNKVLYADRLLPIYESYPIPFTFPIIKNNQIELLNSNVYYFEITICEKIIKECKNNLFYIGFGSLSIPGCKEDLFSLNLNTGNYHNNNVVYNICPFCKLNDTIGAGIIYISYNIYQPFFTLNGTLLSFNKQEFNYIKKNIVPVVCLNSLNKIKVNFSQEEFKFDIKNYLFNNKIISNKNLFLKSKLNLKNIKTDDIIYKINTTYVQQIPIFSFIDNNLSNIILNMINENNNLN